jgi:hypothetical protein
MNNKTLYHKSKQALYWDNGDGSLYVTDYKGNNRAAGAPNTIAWVKNDAQGWEYIKQLKIVRGVTKFNYLYRCPKVGTYASNTNRPISRRGHIPKDKALVISVRA